MWLLCREASKNGVGNIEIINRLSMVVQASIVHIPTTAFKWMSENWENEERIENWQ